MLRNGRRNDPWTNTLLKVWSAYHLGESSIDPRDLAVSAIRRWGEKTLPAETGQRLRWLCSSYAVCTTARPKRIPTAFSMPAGSPADLDPLCRLQFEPRSIALQEMTSFSNLWYLNAA